MAVEKNSVVFFHYTLTLDGGEEVDSSRGGDPFAYLHGHNNIVPGLEKELVGKNAGDTVKAVVSPEEGYGVEDPSLNLRVPIEAFPPEALADLAPGMMFQSQHPDDPNREIILRVMKIDGPAVFVTGNHPLAGKTLNFDVEIVSMRDASVAELADGFVHGPGGHQQ